MQVCTTAFWRLTKRLQRFTKYYRDHLSQLSWDVSIFEAKSWGKIELNRPSQISLKPIIRFDQSVTITDQKTSYPLPKVSVYGCSSLDVVKQKIFRDISSINFRRRSLTLLRWKKYKRYCPVDLTSQPTLGMSTKSYFNTNFNTIFQT